MTSEQRENDYRKVRKLGEGSFGEAFLVEHVESGQQAVCKEMKLNSLGVGSPGRNHHPIIHGNQGPRGPGTSVHCRHPGHLQDHVQQAGHDSGVRGKRGHETRH